MSGDDDNAYVVPQYNLTPTIDPADSSAIDSKIPCSDWKGCFSSTAIITVVVAYGLVCGLTGYRLNLCNGNHT